MSTEADAGKLQRARREGHAREQKLLSCLPRKSIWQQQKINSLDRIYKHRHRSLNLIWLAINARSSTKTPESHCKRMSSMDGENDDVRII